MSSVCAVIVGTSMVLGQAAAPESNSEHLKEFGEAFAGEWIGEFAVDVTIPGVAEKGDKVKLCLSMTWILDKTALEANWKADINGKPAGSGKRLIGWDRATEEIKGFGFGSFGGRGESTHQKLGDRWIVATTGAGVDGRKTAGQTIVTFSDGGKTQVAEITGRVSPKGEALPNFTITYKRAK